MDTVLESVLIEEYERKKKNINTYIKKIEQYPRGTLIEKKRLNHSAYYLAYRNDGKVVTDYVKIKDLDKIRNLIDMRNQIIKEYKNLKNQIKDLGKILKITKLKGVKFDDTDI